MSNQFYLYVHGCGVTHWSKSSTVVATPSEKDGFCSPCLQRCLSYEYSFLSPSPTQATILVALIL